MTFGESVQTCFEKYVSFKGRATRSEYWYFYLFTAIIGFCCGFVDGLMDTNIFAPIWQLATFLPMIAVGVRRMHDVGKSGWFLLIPIYNIVLCCTSSQEGYNKYDY